MVMSWFYSEVIEVRKGKTLWRPTVILPRPKAFKVIINIAFKRNGKVVISERDPWAMRGYELFGQIAESVGLTWGGRWKSIKDFGHTEYRMPGLKKTAEMAHQLIHEGQLQTQTFQP